MLLVRSVEQSGGNKKGRGSIRGLWGEIRGKGQRLSGHGNTNARHGRRARQQIEKRVAEIDGVMSMILSAVPRSVNPRVKIEKNGAAEIFSGFAALLAGSGVRSGMAWAAPLLKCTFRLFSKPCP